MQTFESLPRVAYEMGQELSVILESVADIGGGYDENSDTLVRARLELEHPECPDSKFRVAVQGAESEIYGQNSEFNLHVNFAGGEYCTSTGVKDGILAVECPEVYGNDDGFVWYLHEEDRPDDSMFIGYEVDYGMSAHIADEIERHYRKWLHELERFEVDQGVAEFVAEQRVKRVKRELGE